MATITKRGGGWFAQIRRKGYPTQYKTFRLKADAVAWAREREGAIDGGAVPRGSRGLTATTLGAVLRRYIREVTPTKRSADTERMRLEKLQRDPVCDLDLASLSAHAISAYRDRRLVEVKPATVRRELALLHHALHVAGREWGYGLATNPIALVTPPSVDDARDRRLRVGELERLEEAMATTRNPLVRPVVLLAIETAMRRAEILNLRRRDLDFAQRTVHIPWSKTGKSRTIPLTGAALSILNTQAHRAGGGELLFPISPNALRLAWERIRSRAKLSDLRFHDLRHEAISRFCELGLSMAEVALISGHRDYRMLARYTHLHPVEVARKLAGRSWEAETSSLNPHGC